jgi:hypothetical protein
MGSEQERQLPRLRGWAIYHRIYDRCALFTRIHERVVVMFPYPPEPATEEGEMWKHLRSRFGDDDTVWLWIGLAIIAVGVVAVYFL